MSNSRPSPARTLGQSNCFRISCCAGWLILLAGLGCGRDPATAAGQTGSQAIPVKIEVAQSTAVNDSSEYVATLRSRDSAVIMPQVDGVITQILVRSGDHVSPGGPLVQIEASKQQAAVKSVEDSFAAQRASLKYAQQQYDRINKLYQAGVSSKQDYDQARTSLDAAEAQLRALEAQVREQGVQLRYYRVEAPTSGIVGDIPVRVGDRVTTTTVLTTIDKPGSLEAYIYIPVERAPQIRMNMPVQIVDGSGNVLADSHVSFISPQVDNSTQTVLVKASIANNKDKLRTLQFIRARMIWGTQNVPLVPVLAVSRIGGQYFVFVAHEENGKLVARQRPLQLGEIVENNYVVREGLKPGDKVIVSGTQFLVDGVPVTPQSSS